MAQRVLFAGEQISRHAPPGWSVRYRTDRVEGDARFAAVA
jgi:hypothetical protein